MTWDGVAEADSYNMYWSTIPGVSKTTGTRIENVSAPYHLDGLTFGVTCYVVVTAVADQTLESPESAEVSVFVLRPAQAGPDIEQYFDNAYNAASAAAARENYDDRSRHPLTIGTTEASLLWGATKEQNCLGCHGAKYKSGGARHFSNECLKCHFENQPGSGSPDSVRHGNGVVELSTITGNGLPGSQYAIATLVDYDNWCLQCHDTGKTVTLGGVVPSGKTVIDNAAFENGRHRAQDQGCISCHQPHGRSNTRIVRENPDNRRSRGVGPFLFGVYPNDNTGSYGPMKNQSLNYRSRVDANYADAADENGFCNVACHIARLDSRFRKDKLIRRDNITGNYQLAPDNNKIYLVNGVGYTRDNTSIYQHQHPNGEIITTDDMVDYYGAASGMTGPSRYKYPGTFDANPNTFNNAASPLPFFPDYVDGSRDFTNAYANTGLRIKYRFTCSTCHNPHGTTLANTPTASGYPDLRISRFNDALCVQCHR